MAEFAIADQKEFCCSGRILGGKLSQYLLEKSRIVNQHYGERNFHVFYELLSGVSAELKLKLKLGKPQEYHYLSKVGSDCRQQLIFQGILISMNCVSLQSWSVTHIQVAHKRSLFCIPRYL